MHEIITLQFGTQSNFLGTHFWNTQESYFTYGQDDRSYVDHDRCFRPGIGADGSDTFTPRTLIYDVKDAFGTLRQFNALYDDQESRDSIDGVTSGNIPVIRQRAITQHPYQQHLDLNMPAPRLTSSTVRYWSDYNRVFYHPRSLMPLQTSSITTSIASLHSWEAGLELFDNEDREEDIIDRDFRSFLEECDQLQGVLIVTGNDNAWGGFASKYIDRLRDELGKGVLWVNGVQETLSNSENRERRLQRQANSIRSLYSLGSSASLYSPLTTSPQHTPQYLNIEATSAWHTSALQAIWLETISLPTRLKGNEAGGFLLAELEQTFTAVSSQRKVIEADLCADGERTITNGIAVNGMGTSHHEATSDLPSTDAVLDIALFPPQTRTDTISGRLLRPHLFSRVDVRRGTTLAASSISQPQDPYHATRLSSVLNTPFPLSLDSFPTILTPPSDDFMLHANASSTANVANWLRSLAHQSRRILPYDDREEVSSTIRTWADEYVEGWESAEDSSDDEN